VHLTPLFNILWLRLSLTENIFLGSVKVLRRINEFHSLEVLIFIKRHALLVQTYYNEISDLPTKVQDTATYRAWTLHEE